MKKLIIAVCAFAVGYVANAAAVSWDFWTADGLATDGLNIYTTATALSDITAVSQIIAADLSAEQMKLSKIEGGAWATGGSDLGDASTINFVITYNDGKNDWYWQSGVQDVSDYLYNPPGDPATIETAMFEFEPGTPAGEGWTKISDAPEPTSGLLILLGMAGLALKRKQK